MSCNQINSQNSTLQYEYNEPEMSDKIEDNFFKWVQEIQVNNSCGEVTFQIEE